MNVFTFDTLKLHGQAITLVDQVEDNLLTYFRTKDLRAGDAIPNEMELAANRTISFSSTISSGVIFWKRSLQIPNSKAILKPKRSNRECSLRTC